MVMLTLVCVCICGEYVCGIYVCMGSIFMFVMCRKCMYILWLVCVVYVMSGVCMGCMCMFVCV